MYDFNICMFPLYFDFISCFWNFPETAWRVMNYRQTPHMILC